MLKCLFTAGFIFMKKILYIGLITLVALLSSWTPTKTFASAISSQKINSIIKIESINELPKIHPQETIVFFDIDDTLLDFPYMLGSRAWRKYITQATTNSDKNWHDILSLFLARHHPLIPVEPKTVQVVNDLQALGYAVCGLTARERDIWYDTPTLGIDSLTINQLKSIDIRFDHSAFEKQYPEFAIHPEYFEGVFFVNTETKGIYLKHLLEKTAQRPQKIIFIDDKLSQVESVAAALNELQIDNECYWYCATEEKALKFNSFIANIQLYYFWMSQGQEILSDENARLLSQQFPDIDEEVYLQAVLKSLTLPAEFGK